MSVALPEDLERFAALRAQGGLALGVPFVHLPTTASTNDDAKAAAKEGAPHGAVWVADAQTRGRGRQGRTWLAPPGESLLTSVLLRVACPPSRLPSLSLAVGLAVRDAAADLVPGHVVGIKWPNDVVVGRRKLGGILVESLLGGSGPTALIVGIGLNVRTTSFPSEIADRAVSLAQLRSSRIETTPGAPEGGVGSPPASPGAAPGGAAPGGAAPGAAPRRDELLVAILRNLADLVPQVAGRGLISVASRLAAADVLRGECVRSEQGSGTAEGIDEEGRLLVRDDGGILRRWSAGEVHLGALP